MTTILLGGAAHASAPAIADAVSLEELQEVVLAVQPKTSLELEEENIEDLEVEVQWKKPIVTGAIGGAYAAADACECDIPGKIAAGFAGGITGAVGGARAALIDDAAKAAGKVIEYASDVVHTIGTGKVIEKISEGIEKIRPKPKNP